MKLAIIGSRNFYDLEMAKETFSLYFRTYKSDDGYPEDQIVTEIVSGGAKGADKIGSQISELWNIKLTEFLPDWEKYGKRAGFLRNQDIIEHCDVVLCFWDGKSKGSGNSLSIAKRLKKPTIIIYF